MMTASLTMRMYPFWDGHDSNQRLVSRTEHGENVVDDHTVMLAKRLARV